MTTSPDCRCGGTGAYTVEISLADAVVPDKQLCLTHGLRLRARVYDTSRCCIGVVMEINTKGDRAWLRSPGGGREWSTAVGSLRPAEDQS